MSERRPFYCECVSWREEEMPVLEHLIDVGEEITLDQFSKLVDEEAWCDMKASMGYGQGGMKIADDYHVRFKRDPESGIPFMVHSAIEYVFATPDEVEDLLDRLLDSVELPDPSEDVEGDLDLEKPDLW